MTNLQFKIVPFNEMPPSRRINVAALQRLAIPLLGVAALTLFYTQDIRSVDDFQQWAKDLPPSGDVMLLALYAVAGFCPGALNALSVTEVARHSLPVAFMINLSGHLIASMSMFEAGRTLRDHMPTIDTMLSRRGSDTPSRLRQYVADSRQIQWLMTTRPGQRMQKLRGLVRNLDVRFYLQSQPTATVIILKGLPLPVPVPALFINGGMGAAGISYRSFMTGTLISATPMVLCQCLFLDMGLDLASNGLDPVKILGKALTLIGAASMGLVVSGLAARTLYKHRPTLMGLPADASTEVIETTPAVRTGS